ncbi:Protein of uncharacterised function (DUF1493) [Serratia ficaria]|uniref:DUF1493 family protein n=1 Tax=Serratia ficaria TaxID=61651 RepID=UPI00218374CB|nr:DUF1493 family protein [Serratia ficaria]CAI2497270.1 Protein of uncharacterised function (DUF1493) [Serratia ficaria]
MVTDAEKAVFALVEDYNGFWLWLFKRYPLTKETDLRKDFRMAPEDAYELMERYVELFNIDPKDIHFSKYYPENNKSPREPLTINMLIESAKAGRWLY